MYVAPNMKVATLTTKLTSESCITNAFLCLKLLKHDKKEEIKESKIKTGYWYADCTQE